MKMIKNLTVAALALAFIASPLTMLAADKTAKAKPYPLDTCVVTGEKLGGMGDPVVYVYQGQEVKFCCKGCVTTFKKDPAKYIKKIEEAAKNKK